MSASGPSGLLVVGPDLGPNCLLGSLADHTSRPRVTQVAQRTMTAHLNPVSTLFTYSKTCFKRPLEKKTKIGFQDRL